MRCSALGHQEGYKVWETDSGNVRFTLPSARPEAAVFSPDGSLIAFRDPRTARLLSAETGEVLASTNASFLYGDTPVFSPDGSRLLIKQGEKRQLFQLERIAGVLELIPGPVLATAQPDISYSAAFSPDSTLALVSDNTGVTLWRVADGTLVRRYTNGHEYSSVTFSPDGSVFLGGTENIRQLSVNGELLREFTAEDNEDVYGYAPVLSPGGRYLLSNYYSLILWDTETGKQIADLTRTPLFANYNEPFAVSFGAGENTLYTASSSGAVEVRDLSSSDGAVDQARKLFQTESFTLALDLTATYLNTSRYSVGGTFRFGDEPLGSLSGKVCVPEGLEPQELTVQTSPTKCNVNFSVGDEAAPEWRGAGSTPFGRPPVALFDVSRGRNAYSFELQPLQR